MNEGKRSYLQFYVAFNIFLQVRIICTKYRSICLQLQGLLLYDIPPALVHVQNVPFCGLGEMQHCLTASLVWLCMQGAFVSNGRQLLLVYPCSFYQPFVIHGIYEYQHVHIYSCVEYDWVGV